jgi:hypothetical protein
VTHHSYNPGKDCPAAWWLRKTVDGVDMPDCQPSSWHWDTFGVSRAIPIAIRTIAAGRLPMNTDIAIDPPAPAGASLRFGAGGDTHEVSLDGGATWTPAVRRLGGRDRGGTQVLGHMASFDHPIPAGTTRVRVRGTTHAQYPLGFFDMHLWTLQVAPTPTPTPEPAATATPEPSPTGTPEPTGTVVVPTETPTPEPTPTATPEPTPAPTPEPTQTPTQTPAPTATPPSVCEVLGRRDGLPAWLRIPCLEGG